MSMDGDKATAQAVRQFGNEGVRTMETLEKYGLDFGVTGAAKAMNSNDAAGTALAATDMVINVLSLGRGSAARALEKQAGEQLSKRFILTKGETVAGGIPMADWLAQAKNGSRGIVMEVFTGTNKSITTVGKQLANGMDYLNNKGVKNVVPYVMVNSQKAARRVQDELGKVRGHTVKIIIGP